MEINILPRIGEGLFKNNDHNMLGKGLQTYLIVVFDLIFLCKLDTKSMLLDSNVLGSESNSHSLLHYIYSWHSHHVIAETKCVQQRPPKKEEDVLVEMEIASAAVAGWENPVK